jgi:hypothetical protein
MEPINQRLEGISKVIGPCISRKGAKNLRRQEALRALAPWRLCVKPVLLRWLLIN